MSEASRRRIKIQESRDLRESLRVEGYEGQELFEKVANRHVQLKENTHANRCPRCWHDKVHRCICQFLPYLTKPMLRLPVKVLILMHYKEYLSAGDDAKLLLAMLPKANAEIFVFGKEGEWDRFQRECAKDPVHTLTLWPGQGALTVQEFLCDLSDDSPWRRTTTTGEDPSNLGCEGEAADRQLDAPASLSLLPTLRVIVLDGVYSNARNMFKTMRKKLTCFPPFVALHPETLSVYHRALKSYGASSAVTVSNSKDPKALHICTVEAYALLLKELGEWDAITDELVAAVVVNNGALRHSLTVRPEGGKPMSTSSGAARRRRKKLQEQAIENETRERTNGRG